jgi:hypothetical protein
MDAKNTAFRPVYVSGIVFSSEIIIHRTYLTTCHTTAPKHSHPEGTHCKRIRGCMYSKITRGAYPATQIELFPPPRCATMVGRAVPTIAYKLSLMPSCVNATSHAYLIQYYSKYRARCPKEHDCESVFRNDVYLVLYPGHVRFFLGGPLCCLVRCCHIKRSAHDLDCSKC